MTPEQSVAANVEKSGFSIIRISDVTPSFAYTVGLMFKQRHPEMILVGMRESGHLLLRGMAMLVTKGRRFDVAGEHGDILENVPVVTRPVHPTQHEFYMGYAMGYCRERGRTGELEAVQVFWPDKRGFFPFQKGCDERVSAAQPRLDQALGTEEIRKRREQLG